MSTITIASYVLTTTLEIPPVKSVEIWYNSSYNGFTLKIGSAIIIVAPTMTRKTFMQKMNQKFPFLYTPEEISSMYLPIKRQMDVMTRTRVDVQKT